MLLIAWETSLFNGCICTHTQLASYTEREICNHVLEGKRLLKRFKLQPKLKKNPKRYSSQHLLKETMKKHNTLASKTSSLNGCPYHYQVNNWLYLSSWTKIPGGVLPYICLISIDRLLVLGAFLWDDLDEDQWSQITRIMADQMIRWILVQSGFIGSFDLPWSECLKGAHPFIWNKI